MRRSLTIGAFLLGLLAAVAFFDHAGRRSACAEEAVVRVFANLPGAPEGICVDSQKNPYVSYSSRIKTVVAVKLKDFLPPAAK